MLDSFPNSKESVERLLQQFLSTLNGNSPVRSAAILTEPVHLFAPKFQEKLNYIRNIFSNF